MSRRVLVLNTGGTIGMARTDKGNAPSAGVLRDALFRLVAEHPSELPAIEIIESDPLIDSSNATPATWTQIATTIFEQRERFDGFVVLHGTDTMAYTSSALSFMLPDFGKPVVLTGSQIPLGVARSDGRQNLISALQVAGSTDIPEVSLVFGDTVLRGNRATKVDSSGMAAFDSPNMVPLARLGVDISVDHAVVRRSLPGSRPQLRAGQPAHIAAVRLFPGFEGSTLANLVRDPLQGLILQAYGAGNGPANDAEFLRAIEDATRRGVVVMVVTQCVRGSVDPSAYVTGSALADAGALPGYDMTTEAALTKLAVLLGSDGACDATCEQLTSDIAGELTAPVTAQPEG